MSYSPDELRAMETKVATNVAKGRARILGHPALVEAPKQKPEVTFQLGKPSDEAKLNKTEARYLAYLRMLRIENIGIQNVTLKLADDCRLTLDFNYIDENGRWLFIDVKGFQREDALIKIKVAARMFPHLDFAIVKRDGTGWTMERVKP